MKKTTVIFAALASAALIAGGSKAHAEDTLCKANIMATLGNAPAMTSMTITITRGENVVTSTTGHSLSTPLICGDYTAKIKMGDLERTRQFTAGTETTVKIPMDQ